MTSDLERSSTPHAGQRVGSGPWLVLAAVERELAPCRVLLDGRRDVHLATTGIGPVNAAIAVERALSGAAPRGVVLLGSGGAYPEHALAVGDVVIASEEIFADDGVATSGGERDLREVGIPLASRDGVNLWNEVPVSVPDEARLERATRAARGRFRVEVGRLITSARCAGTAELAAARARRWSPWLESMEGAAAAYASWLRDVPFFEVRGASNAVGPRDRGAWDIDRASRNAAIVASALLDDPTDPPGEATP